MIEKKTILLVEDNPHDEALALRALKKGDVRSEIVVARDGAEALDYLFSASADTESHLDALPAVVLLDLNLPKIGGLEVLKRIRGDKRTRLLPVIILTSSNEERDLIEGYGSGCNSYVRKPIDFNEFAEAVRQLGVYWLVVNEAPPVPA
jgi:CheY-like chemotaxis protein